MKIQNEFTTMKTKYPYKLNYYLSGLFYNGDKYHEQYDYEEELWAGIDEIKEAEQEFIKMGLPANHADSVVRLIGLQMIIEVDCDE